MQYNIGIDIGNTEFFMAIYGQEDTKNTQMIPFCWPYPFVFKFF